MSGFGILGTLVAVTVALVVGVPLALAGGAIVLALAGVALAVGVVGGLFWLLFRVTFVVGGALLWLIGGGLMILIAGAIASHLLPILIVGFVVWLIVRANRPAAMPPSLIAA